MAEPGGVRTIARMYLVAMALFLVTVVIGILNGADAVEFNNDQILTHVHSGTLGWISLALIATAMWMFNAVDRRLALVIGVLIPIYVGAFYTGNLPARAIGGTALLVAILWVLAWVWRAWSRERTLPGLAVALGFTTFTYGSLIGVLIQIERATGTTIFNQDAVGGHASAMVFSYLILVAMGLIEWRALGTNGLPKAGLVQLLALFTGGALLTYTLLFLSAEATQAVGGIYLLLQLIAVGLFTGRVMPAVLRGDGGAHLKAAAIFVLIAIAIFLYLIFLFIQSGDPNNVNFNLIKASDHAAFIGVITNLVFAVILTLTTAPAAGGMLARVGFWAMNLGLLIFLVGLGQDIAEIKRIGAPLMGVGILLVLYVLAMRLWRSTRTSMA
ncbi:MAG: hypothetical protein ABI598_03300 [Chloroflexota bacterium]